MKIIRSISVLKNKYFLIGIVLVATFLVFSPSLKNDFTNWDDLDYVVNNDVIRGLSLDHLKQIFSVIIVKNWHPLTILSYAVEHFFFKLNPFVFHLTNLVLHLFNTLFVFCLIRKISERIEIAFFVALLFGIHPLHVESVAWIAERKDVLFTFFYLSGLLIYLDYLKDLSNVRKYFLVLVFFLLSLMSKVTAVSFPLILCLLDLYSKRSVDRKSILEKIPFFLLSILFGVIAMKIHADVLITRGKYLYQFNFLERILLSCDGILLYLSKILLPIKLGVLYPYPEKINNLLSLNYYLAPIGVLLILVIVLLNRKREGVIFGSMFFIFAIFQNLPFSIIGQALIADRYTYLPSIGIFFLMVSIVCGFMRNDQRQFFAMKYILGIVIFMYLGFLSVKTYERCQIWKDSETLWTTAIVESPKVWTAYYNRASLYLEKGLYEKAIDDFNKTQEYGPVYVLTDVLGGRAQAYGKMGNVELALKDLNNAIAIRPNSLGDYNNRGIVYLGAKRYPEAIDDFLKAIEIGPHFTSAFNNRGIAYLELGSFDMAISDFQTVLARDPGSISAMENLAKAYQKKGDFDGSIGVYNKMIAKDPGNVKNYYNRAVIFLKKKDYGPAIKDLTVFLERNPQFPLAYYSRSMAYFTMGEFKPALFDALKAKEFGFPIEDGYLNILKKALASEK